MHKTKFTLLFAVVLTAFTQNSVAFQKGDFLVRGGSATVSPNDSTSDVTLGGAGLGFDTNVQKDTQLGLTFSYFLTDRISLEVLASTPFNHDIDFGVNDPLGTGDRLGDIKHLPPTLSLNYYLNNDTSSKFQPYVGAGINYMIFFDEGFSSANEAAGLDDLELENTFGVALQAGIDYKISDKFYLNGTVRWIDVNTEANFNLNGIDGSVDRVEIDPFVFALSVGYVF